MKILVIHHLVGQMPCVRMEFVLAYQNTMAIRMPVVALNVS